MYSEIMITTIVSFSYFCFFDNYEVKGKAWMFKNASSSS